MNPDMQKELFSRLDALASKLGVTAQYLWGVLIREARIEGIMDVAGIAFIFLLIIAGWVTTRIVYKIDQKKNAEGYDDRYRFESDTWKIFATGSGILTVIGVAVAITLASDAIPAFLNPQYWALQQILGALK